MIPSPNAFRVWKDFGARGPDELERYARTEYRDGSLAWMQDPSRPLEDREPSLLRRLGATFRTPRARSGRSEPSAIGHIRPGTAAVHFAEEPQRHADPCARAAAATVLLVPPEDLETCDVECNES